MVKTLEYAKNKWERKTAGKGAKWKKNVTAHIDDYARNMAQFLGLSSINSQVLDAYRNGVEAVTPEAFSSAISGKGKKWADRLKEAFE